MSLDITLGSCNRRVPEHDLQSVEDRWGLLRVTPIVASNSVSDLEEDNFACFDCLANLTHNLQAVLIDNILTLIFYIAIFDSIADCFQNAAELIDTAMNLCGRLVGISDTVQESDGFPRESCNADGSVGCLQRLGHVDFGKGDVRNEMLRRVGTYLGSALPPTDDSNYEDRP